jgi:hypothetical protein
MDSRLDGRLEWDGCVSWGCAGNSGCGGMCPVNYLAALIIKTELDFCLAEALLSPAEGK